MSKHVLVIGAGPGGLASAMLLASAGLRVTVVEAQQRIGGRTSTLERDGFRFDMGPTFFLYPGVLETVFERCGLNLHDHVDLKKLDPQYHLIFEQGGDLLATPDVPRMQEAIAKLSPDDATRLPRYLDDTRRKFSAFRPVLESPFNSVMDLLKFNPVSLLPLLRPFSSVDSDLGRYFKDERVRLAFSFQSKYLGMSPFQCPSLFTILSFLEYEYGVFHPVGGCGAVSQAMAKVAGDMGVEFRLGEPVREMLFEGHKACGVRTDEGLIHGDAVVVNADFADAMTKLVPDKLRRKWTDSKLAGKRYSCSTFMMYLGIRGRYDDLQHHTIFLADNYAENLKDIEDRHVLSANPSIYVQNPCVTDDTLAPDGLSSLYVLAPVTHEHGNVDWSKQTAGFRQTVMQQLAKLGLDDLENRIVSEQIMTPQHWQTDMNIYRGAVFNLAHTFRQMLHLRPHNRFEDLDGVYLTGGGTHPGSGLPVIYQSSLISTDLLLNDFGVARQTAASSKTYGKADSDDNAKADEKALATAGG